MSAPLPNSVLAKIEVISPEYAAFVLEHKNPHNRPLAKKTWECYKTDIINNRFQFNGEPIIFDWFGNLLDGQHRLKAIAESGFSISLMVIRGIDPNAQNSMDAGAKREAKHILGMEGKSDPALYAATARLLSIYEDYGAKYWRSGSQRCTRATQLEYAISHANEIEAGLRMAGKIKKEALIPPSLASTCFVIFSRQNPEKSDLFFEQFVNGANLGQDSPVRILRNRLIHNLSLRSKLPLMELAALMFIAWRAFRDNRVIRNLAWRQDADFPQI